MKRLALCTTIAIALSSSVARADAPSEDPQGTPTQTSPSETRRRTSVCLKLDGGVSFHRLYPIDALGADFGGGVGLRISEHLALWLSPRGWVGSTENGLSLWSGRVAFEAEGIVGRFRFGLGAGPFVMGVKRALRDETLRSFGPEIHTYLRVDVVGTEDFQLFLRGAVSGAWELADGGAFWGPTVGMGVDFDFGANSDEQRNARKATKE